MTENPILQGRDRNFVPPIFEATNFPFSYQYQQYYSVLIRSYTSDLVPNATLHKEVGETLYQ